MPFRVLAVNGSLRSASSNLGLLRMAQRLAPTGLIVSAPYPIHELPFYDPDLDTEVTLPAAARAWREAVSAVDAVLWVAPEYNYGPSAVMKNAIDWATRPLGSHPLAGKPVAVMTSGGGGGGVKVQEYLHTIFGALAGTVVVEPQVAVVKGATIVSPAGSTSDPAVEALVTAKLANLLAVLQSPGE